MKYFASAVCSLVVVLPISANAVGTYYTKGAQRSYSSYANNAIVQKNIAKAAPNITNNCANNVKANNVMDKNVTVAKNTKNGFYMGLGFSHEVSSWEFDMKQAGSKLHYDNVGWNALNINAGYKFGGNIPLQIDLGFKYGMQSGESTMVDDDVTNGGFIANDEPWVVKIDEDLYNVYSIQHGLSIGKTNDGKMIGFNVGLGFTDAFKIGNLRFSPSIGYRYLKYKLQTRDNSTVSVETIDVNNNCSDLGNGEYQCGPLVVFFDIQGDDEPMIVYDVAQHDEADIILNQTSYPYVSTENTFYDHQYGTSHSYEVLWSGPYVAMDMNYDINQYNAANARVELGFPGYESTGDQPYRYDLQHPTSFKDKANMFQAFHLGLAANWMTAITDSLSFSLGVTYDYYNVKDADTTTYLNPDVYGIDETTLSNEVKSTFKSLGANVGLAVKF